MFADGEPNLHNPETIFQSTNESYNTFVRQQQNQRHKDRRNRVRTGCIDQRKRIVNPMLTENANLDVANVYTSTIHHHFETSTSNEATANISNLELQESSTLLNVPITSYVLPTCTYCEHCGAQKFYKESKSFCCSDGKVKLYMCDSPTELFNLFTSTEPKCMEFKKIARG